MPEIKNTFVQGRMNKDLDERLIPNGEYRDAMNVQVSTSEGSNVGTVQNILGNMSKESIIPPDCKCVGAIADEKNNKLYWFVRREFNPNHSTGHNFHAIIEYSPETNKAVPVIVDTKVGTADAVLKFPNKIITGINIIDNLLFWTDGVNEPRKINIDECKKGTDEDALSTGTHTVLKFEMGSFHGATIWGVFNAPGDASSQQHPITGENLNGVTVTRYENQNRNNGSGIYGSLSLQHAKLAFKLDDSNINSNGMGWSNIPIRHYRNGERIHKEKLSAYIFMGTQIGTGTSGSGSWSTGPGIRYELSSETASGVSYRGADWDDFKPGDIIFGDGIDEDIREEHITVIKKSPNTKLNVKINTVKSTTKDSLFEKVLPRFSYRYKYIDNQYSAFAPFTDVVFNPEHKEGYSLDTAYSTKDSHNTSMVNSIDSIELSDFLSQDTPEDVIQVDILYKKENSNTVYSIASIQHSDREMHDISGLEEHDFEEPRGRWSSGSRTGGGYTFKHVIGGKAKGKYIVNSENINGAIPENQLLRAWDNVPKKALAQEITGNRVVYGNYVQGYTPDTKIPELIAGYTPRNNTKFINNSFEDSGLPSIKSQRNYQLGIIFGDKYGRETPVFSSNNGAIQIPWYDKNGSLSASQSNQLTVKLENNPPSFAEYIKYFVKETSSEYYNLIMEKVYVPEGFNDFDETKDHVWLSFPSSDRNKIKEEDYLILKKKIGAGEKQVDVKNKFRVVDIKNEAPEAVKYDYISLGKVMSSDFPTDMTDLFSDSTYRPTENQTQIRILRDGWTDETGSYLSGLGDARWDYLDEQMYVSFTLRLNADGRIIKRSNRYRIIKSWAAGTSTDTHWRLVLDKPISTNDASWIDLTNSDLGFEVEYRKEKNLELFDGKFFVKVTADQIIYRDEPGLQGGNYDNTWLINDYFISARQPVYWLADTQTSNAWDVTAGIVNADFGNATQASNSNRPTGHSTSLQTGESTSSFMVAKNAHSWWVIWREAAGYGNAAGNSPPPLRSGKFFIDNMYLKGGQLSNNNFAKNSGEIWAGNEIVYPSKPKWKGVYAAEESDSNKIANNGWLYEKNQTGRLPGGAVKENIVNGLEGVLTAGTNHSDGFRRWRIDTGDGINGIPEYDEVYKEDKFYLHISFLAPGDNLTLNHTDFTFDSIQGDSAIGKDLMGIWGGGIITKQDGTAFGANNDLTGVLMEGYDDWENADSNTPPGPGVEGSFGYDMNWAERHYNQWNPAYPQDPDGKIQAFIDKLEPGNKFKFKDSGNHNIYTILNKSIKKVYNAVSWRSQYIWDDTNSVFKLSSDSAIDGDLITIEDAIINWADTLDSNGANGDSSKLDIVKSRLRYFGRSYNRRIVYILELDKDPSVQGFNPVDGASLDANTSGDIEFLSSNPINMLSGDPTKSIIWETESKENVDLEIYHEASDAIPVKITKENNELFAPVGCKVEILDFPDAINGDIIIKESSYLESWGYGDDDYRRFKIEPGFNFYNSNTEELNYSNLMVRFYREDGSYTTARLSAQPGDGDDLYMPAEHSIAERNEMQGNTIAASTNQKYKKYFVIDPIVGKDMETGLSWYNCFSFGNGIESNRIRDDFNETQIKNGPIVSSTIDTDYKEENRENGLIYSGIYNSNSTTNNLNQFIMAEKITKDLNPTYGSIQKLFQRRIGLVSFCEDRVVNIIANKDTLFNADGNSQLTASNRVLGDATPFVGDYGISKNPESFAQESYRAYFTDKQRGAVLRLSMDGLTTISDIGMRDWFRDNLQDPNELIGTYDEYKKDYNLSLTREFTQNLLVNSDISEGQPLINLTPPSVNLIENGGVEHGNNLTIPDLSGTSRSENTRLENRYLDSRTTITNHDEIAVGELYPGPGQPHGTSVGAWAGADSQFQSLNPWKQLVNFDFRGISAGNSGGNFTTYDNPFTSWQNNYTGNGGYVFHKVIGSSSTGSSPYSNYDNQWAFGVNHHTQPFSNGRIRDEGAGYIGAAGVSDWNPNVSHHSRQLGMFRDASGIIHHGDFRDYCIIPYSHETGTMPSNLIHSDVANWHTNTQNTTGSGLNVDYSSAQNMTIFAGEEIRVDIWVAMVDSYGSTPSAQNAINFKLELLDGTTVVPHTCLIKPNSPAYDRATGTTYSPHRTNYSFSNPFTDAKTYATASSYPTHFTRDPINTDPTDQKRGFHRPTQAIYPEAGHVDFDLIAQNTTHANEFLLRAYFKFQGNGSAGSGNPAGEEGIVVNNLNIRLRPTFTSPSNHSILTWSLNQLKVIKSYEFKTPKIEPYAGVTINPIPSSVIPSWAEVQHSMSHYDIPWVFAPDRVSAVDDVLGLTGNDPLNFDIAVLAKANYGPSTGLLQTSTDSGYTWTTPAPNGVTAYNDYADGHYYTQNDEIYIDSDNRQNGSVEANGHSHTGAYIYQHINSPSLGATPINNDGLHANNWYVYDIVVRDYTAGSIHTRKVNTLSYGATATGGVSWHASNMTSPAIFGSIGNPQGNGRGVGFAQIDSKWNTTQEDESKYRSGIAAGYNLPFTLASNETHFRAVFMIDSQSDIALGNATHVYLQFWGFTGTVTYINITNVTDTVTGGDFSNYTLTTPPVYYNSFSRPKLYYNNGVVRFDKAEITSTSIHPHRFTQVFDSDTTIPWYLTPNTDGYQFSIELSNFANPTGNEMVRIQVRGWYDGTTDWDGLVLELDEAGFYDVDFNVNGTVATTITKDGVTGYAPPVVGSVSAIYPTALRNNNNFSNRIEVVAVGTEPLSCDVSSIRVMDKSSLVIGGAIEHWDIVGFDPVIHSYVTFDAGAGNINISNAPSDSQNDISIQQVINQDVNIGDSYRVRFNHNITAGEVEVYYYNKNGDGFKTIPLNSSNSNAYFDETFVIGTADTANTQATRSANELINTFVIRIIGNPTSGTLDNFSMQQVFVGFEPKTITFNEENKGWTSFKSFVPENGISVAKQYYTIKEGQLWQHHSNETRNQFYGLNSVPSSITAVFNQEPSLVKIFNTLNYEGSQSKIDQYVVDGNLSTIKPYNLDPENGWYLDYIITDKQQGTINEFIEKEGKWFNYIKGNQDNTSASELSFQGLGEVSSVN